MEGRGAKATCREHALSVISVRMDKIAIVGAGPSGLSTAHHLRKKGYSDITIFESNARAGGKVYSYRHGTSVIEFGAIWSAYEYEIVKELAIATGVDLVAFEPKKFIVTGSEPEKPFEDFLAKKYGILTVLRDFVAMHGLVHAHRALIDGDLSKASVDLYASAESYFAARDLFALPKMLSVFLSASGYGYFDEVPALYVMKGMDMLLKMARRDFTSSHFSAMPFQTAALFVAPEGFQSIWSRLAETHRVRFETPVREIVRAGDKVAVTVDSGVELFDRVVFSANAKLVPLIVKDLDDEERRLFGKIETYPYVVTLFKAESLARNKAYFLNDNIDSSKRGHVLGFGNRWLNENIYVAYQFATESQSRGELENLLRSDLAPFGATNIEVLKTERWDFFPHFKTKALQEGAYFQLDRIQGKGGLYFVGGLMGFETVEHAARHAKLLVNGAFQ